MSKLPPGVKNATDHSFLDALYEMPSLQGVEKEFVVDGDYVRKKIHHAID